MDEVHGYHDGETHHESHYDSCGHVAALCMGCCSETVRGNMHIQTCQQRCPNTQPVLSPGNPEVSSKHNTTLVAMG